MMKKRILSLVTAAAMMTMLACPAMAIWRPSQTVREVTGVGATATAADGTTTNLEVTVAPRTGTDGVIEDVLTATEAYIKVTPVSETQAANDAMDETQPTLAYGEKAGETTDSGLRYSDNEKVNLVYEAVTRSTSTTQFLEKIGGALLNLVTEAVETIAQSNPQEEMTVDDFTPAALFDVTASAGAIEQMGENGSVDVEMEVPGITVNSNIIAVHFLGAVEDAEALRESLTNDFDNTILNYDAEILNAVAGDGTVTVTMTSFSPVLILTQTATATAAVTEEPSATEAPAAATEATPAPSAEPTQVEPAADNGGNGWILPVVIVAVVVVVVVAVVVTRKNKQTTTTSSKK